MLVRRVDFDITYQGVNITEVLKDDILAITYTEYASGASDTISLSVKNDDKKWLNSYIPLKGDLIEVILNKINWEFDGQKDSMYVGSFNVDSLDASGRPLVVSINGLASPLNSSFQDVERNFTFENISILTLALGIADRYGFGLIYDTNFSFNISSIEQSQESDSDFLISIIEKYGLSMKFFDNNLIIFRQKEYEQKTADITIDESDILSWNISDIVSGSNYGIAKLRYKDDNDTEIEYIFDSGISDKVLDISEAVDSYSEAEIIAKSKLRNENVKNNVIDLTLDINLALFASQTINLTGFGNFDGIYYIDELTHDIGGGSTSSIKCHKILEGDY